MQLNKCITKQPQYTADDQSKAFRELFTSGEMSSDYNILVKLIESNAEPVQIVHETLTIASRLQSNFIKKRITTSKKGMAYFEDL
jgi:hypothetical protein